MRSALAKAVVALLAFGAASAMGQLRLSVPRGDLDFVAAAPSESQSAMDADSQAQREPRVPPANLGLRNAAVVGGSVLAMAAYGKAKWWDEGFTGTFRTDNEGWFGQNTSSGGADKLGHAFFAYAGTRLLTRGFEFIGNGPGQAEKWGFWTTLGIMTAVEVADGYSRQYRFSPQDVVMNVVGAGLGYLMERSPELDRRVDLRLYYKASANSSFDPGGDYSGQIYLLILKASGFDALRTHEPLRYLELGLGYGTRGYESPTSEHRRNVYIGVSLNVSEILRQTVYRGNRERSLAQKGTEMFFEYIQVPGTGVAAKHTLSP